MEANENTLFFLGFIIKRTEEGVIRISDTRYKGENNESFKMINGMLTLLQKEEIIPLDIEEHLLPLMPISVYTHIAEAADAFFIKWDGK